MYGATINTLEVFVNGVLAFSKSGAQGSDWKNGVVDLSSYGSTVTVTFRATRGASFNGDIAIDHFRVEELPLLGCTDPLACNYDSTASVDDGSCYSLVLSNSESPISCNGGSDGSLTVGANVGITSATWSNGDSGVTTDSLSAGTYSVTVTDSLGCVATASIVVSQPQTITYSLIVVDETSAGASDGLIDLTASGGTPCYVGSPLVITEYDPGAPDALEIQNVSGQVLDVTGWTVEISSSYTDINATNTIVQTLSGNMNVNETKYWTDATANNYWGNNIFWNPGSNLSFKGWIMIKDPNGNVMDAFVANWDAAAIAIVLLVLELFGLAQVGIRHLFHQVIVLQELLQVVMQVFMSINQIHLD